MNDEIILSEKYGVNASITTCLLCGKDIGIALFGKLKNDEEAPKKCCIGELCDDCKAKLVSEKKVVIFDETGRYIIISEEYLTPEGLEASNKTKCVFISSQMLSNIINNDKN